MVFGVGMIMLLLVVGGFTAYWGDRVGMIVGRKRLSIFGLRPRYTSRVITVVTGIFIVSFTLGILILISSSAREALFGLENLRKSITALSNDVTVKNAELAELEEQRQRLVESVLRTDAENTQLQMEKAQLEEQRKELGAQNAELQIRNDQLRSENDHLTSRIQNMQADLAGLESERNVLVQQLAELRKAGDYYFDQATRLQQANANLRQAHFIYNALDVIATQVINTRQTPENTKQQLERLLGQANEQVLRSGAGDVESNTGVRIDRIVVGVDNQLTTITTDTVINLVVEAIHSYPDIESVIVQVVALTNAAYGEPILADFNLIQNKLVYKDQTVIASHAFDGRLPASQLFEQVIVWAQGEIRQIVIDAGVMPQADGSIGGVRPSAVYEIVDKIKVVNDWVIVDAYSVGDCWTHGPLQLGFSYH
ncbi:MAG TPA: DUF3084 domain-containing protein [Firmicutes bacterium]|jgi:hypothetical protein|nr:DUF3084 domain-containing protein [Bacillota bacterium]